MTSITPITLGDDDGSMWDNFVTDIAKRLHEGDIPNLLFGSYALSLYGTPYGFSGADFVVDDEKLPNAIALLTVAGLSGCENGPQCHELHKGTFYSNTLPSMHVHAQHLFKEIKDDITFQFYTRSKTLWELPKLSTFATGENHDIRKTSAKKRLDRRGYMDMEEEWKDGGDIWVPSTRVLFRAYALLAVRDDGLPVERYWFDHMLMMAIYLPDTGRLNMEDCGDDIKPLIRAITLPDMDMGKAWKETVYLVRTSAAASEV